MLDCALVRSSVLRVVLGASVLSVSNVAFADAAGSNSRSYEFSAALWLPELETGIEAGKYLPASEITLSEELDWSNPGVTLAAAIREDKWQIVGDLTYLQPEEILKTLGSAPDLTLRSDSTLALLNTYGLFKLAGENRLRLDAGIGFRVVSSKVDAVILSDGNPVVDDRTRGDWVDILIAAKAYGRLSEKGFASLTLDAGVAGSDAADETWQLLVEVGYAVSDDWSVRGGYRHLEIQRDDDGDLYAFELSGITAGVSFTW